MKKILACAAIILAVLLLFGACNVPAEPNVDKNADTSSDGVHVHVFRDATCTEPKTCDGCGETEGNPAGHAWKGATCTEAKTCTECGETQGDANGHNYSNGFCVVCGAKNPSHAAEAMVWIPTNGGRKYHSKSSCSNMKNPKQVTESQAIYSGFEACKRCH